MMHTVTRIPVFRLNPAYKLFSSNAVLPAGHSKWANIKHKKAANDAARATASYKISSKITVLAKMGGTDLSKNLQLGYTIEKARSMSIPKKVIDNALKRATGESKNTDKMEPVLYEGIGPGGVAVVVEAITDNKNRTIGAVRPCFGKYNLSLTPTLYLFQKKGLLLIDAGEKEFDDVFESLLELGCEDIYELDPQEGDTAGPEFETEDSSNSSLVEIITDPNSLGTIVNQVKKLYKIKEMQIGYIPAEEMMVEINDEETLESYHKFLRSLEALDDVTQVYSNLKE